MSSFDLLHPKVQNFIWKQRWENFRPIQDEAISILLKEPSHLIISAPTASGKTEAAFLPIVSRLASEGFDESFRVLYISPLKALINDQFRRVEEMCSDIGIPVTKWHGDVAQSRKNSSIKKPSGILMITPESLESLLIRRQVEQRSAFSKLGWIVIDEIHSFIGEERGAQLRSLIYRIEEESRCHPFRIGLSASINNAGAVAKWMSGAEPAEVLIDSEDDTNGVAGKIRGFFKPSFANDEEPDEKIMEEKLRPYLGRIVELFSTGKNLIFGNSKAKLEDTYHRVINSDLGRRLQRQFSIHHGSLSRDLRTEAEDRIKAAEGAMTIFCTSTLELGIDIGAMEKIGFIDPPWTVNSFAQRLGRSGRRDGSTKQFEFLIRQSELTKDLGMSELFREDLVKSLALSELYQQGFKEDLKTNANNFSTLAHQVLAFSIQKLGTTFTDLEKIILRNGFQSKMGSEDFSRFINHLVEVKMLYRDPNGIITAGRLGERLIEHFEFLSVFATSDQWLVLNEGSKIGEIPRDRLYRKDDRILLAGRVWSILEVNERSDKLLVIPARRGQAPTFDGLRGKTHPMVHQKMLEIYSSDSSFPILDDVGARMLEEARRNFIEFAVNTNPNSSIIGVFAGTKVQNTICLLLEKLGGRPERSECFIQIGSTSPSWRAELLQSLDKIISPIELIQPLPREMKMLEKYDKQLPEDFLNQSYAEHNLDIDAAKEWLKK